MKRLSHVTLLILALVFALVAGTSSIFATEQETPYRDVLRHYGQLVVSNVETSVRDALKSSSLPPSEKSLILKATASFTQAVDQRLETFGDLYDRVWVTNTATTEEKKNFADEEAGLVKSLDQGLQQFWLLNAELQGQRSTRQIRKIVESLDQWTKALAAGGNLDASLQANLDLVLPRGPGPRGRLAAQYLWQFVIHGRSIFQGLARVPESIFLVDQKKIQFDFEGWTPKDFESKNAIFVFVYNHDYALFDVLMSQRMAAHLGVKESGRITVPRSWPHFKIREREENVAFDFENPLEKLADYTRNAFARGDKRVAITIAPEGQVPYFTARFPVTTKHGAFLLARRFAVEHADARPVYLVRAFSNALDHLSSPETTKLRVRVEAPQVVPTNELTKADAWVSRQRLEFEEMSTRYRTSALIDLQDPRRARGTHVPAYAPVANEPSAAARLKVCSDLFSR